MWKWAALILSLLSCAYFNTYYNAETFYKNGIQNKTFGRNVQAYKSFDKSIEKCKKVLKKYPKSKFVDDAFLLIGKNYYQKEQYTLAITKLNEFLQYFPTSPLKDEALYYKALSLAGEKKYADAILILNQLQKKKKWKERALYHIGLIKKESGSLNEAKESFLSYLKVIKKGKYEVEIMKNLAEIYKIENDYPRAIKYLRGYIKRAPPTLDYYKAKIELAELLWETKEYKTALKELNEIMDVYSQLNPDIELLRGKIYKSMKDFKKARSIFEDVGTSKKGKAMFEIAEIYEVENKYDSALIYYDSASMYEESTSDTYIEAIMRKTLLSEYLSSESDSTDVSLARTKFHLAEITLLNLKKPGDAIKQYEEVYNLYPETEFAPKAMFAEIWIMKNILNDSNWINKSQQLISKYDNTEYSKTLKQWLNENKKDADSLNSRK